MYSIQDITRVAQLLGINFDKFTLDDLILTMKIALAHLNKFPNYYNKEYGFPALKKYLRTMRTYY